MCQRQIDYLYEIVPNETNIITNATSNVSSCTQIIRGVHTSPAGKNLISVYTPFVSDWFDRR